MAIFFFIWLEMFIFILFLNNICYQIKFWKKNGRHNYLVNTLRNVENEFQISLFRPVRTQQLSNRCFGHRLLQIIVKVCGIETDRSGVSIRHLVKDEKADYSQKVKDTSAFFGPHSYRGSYHVPCRADIITCRCSAVFPILLLYSD